MAAEHNHFAQCTHTTSIHLHCTSHTMRIHTMCIHTPCAYTHHVHTHTMHAHIPHTHAHTRTRTHTHTHAYSHAHPHTQIMLAGKSMHLIESIGKVGASSVPKGRRQRTRIYDLSTTPPNTLSSSNRWSGRVWVCPPSACTRSSYNP